MTKIGQFGRFQKFLDGVLFVLNLPVAYQILISYFVTFTPPWKCKANTTCSHSYNDHLMPHNDRRRCSVPRNEWYYTEPESYSMVTDFQLDCGREWIVSLLSSVYFVGWAVGGILLGCVGDKYGRKFIIFPSVVTTIVLGFLTSFLKNVYLVIICRFVIGFFNPGAMLQSFILVSEYVGEKHRSFAGLVVYMSLPVGYILVGFQAYLTASWRTLYILCTIPYILTVLFYFFVPESIKWLILNGKDATVLTTLRRVAYWNGKEVSENMKVIMTKEEEVMTGETESGTLIQIFRTRRLLIITAAQSAVWLASGLTYFGLSLVADDLGGTLYRDFILLSVMELPALPVAILLSNHCGRKMATLFPLLIGGVLSCIVVCIPALPHMKIVRTVAGIMGKFWVAIAYDAVYTWTLEMYPIPVRSTGMGILQTVSHLGSGCAPWIAKGLRYVAKWLPYVGLGIPAIMAALIGLYLPETLTKFGEKKNCLTIGGENRNPEEVDEAKVTTNLLKNSNKKKYTEDP